MFFVDTHAHLYKEYYPENFDDVLRRSLEAEVTKIILPCVNANSMPDILEAVEKHPKHLFPLVGLHPSDVKADYEEELTQLEKYLSLNDSLIGVGEIGIDLYHDKTFIKEQEIAFQRQLTWAAERNLPVSIHIRDGYEEAFRILKPFVQNGLNGVLHCFSGGIQEARWAVSYGLKLGIGGVVTFKKNKLENIVKEIGIEHIVLETDAPFLAPDPYRGKQNESSYIPLIANKIATIFDIPLAEVRRITSENACSVFTKINRN